MKMLKILPLLIDLCYKPSTLNGIIQEASNFFLSGRPWHSPWGSRDDGPRFGSRFSKFLSGSMDALHVLPTSAMLDGL